MTSKGEINRCGELLRKWGSPEADSLFAETEIDAALEILREFRKSFQYPMQKTAVGVRQFVKAESTSVVVAQRLKRLPQIIKKLVRMPKTKLARMEDVGGCRAILRDQDEVSRVFDRIDQSWVVIRTHDYVTTPKSSGYRAVHVVVERDDKRIEVQLRTPGQQAWADGVDQLVNRYDLPLKDEMGPPALLDWLKLAAEGIEARERHVDLGVAWEARYRPVVERASQWIDEHGGL